MSVVEALATLLSPAEVCAAVGLRDWHLTSLRRRGRIPPPLLIGRVYYHPRESLAAIRAAAVEAGYITAEVATANG